MWSLFFLLLISYIVGLLIIFGAKYFKDPEEFDGWENLGQFLARLFVGALICLIVATTIVHQWVLYCIIAIAALLSNHWMPWLTKRLR